MATPVDLAALVVSGLAAAFATFPGAVCTGDYTKSGGTVFAAGISFLITPLPAGDCDGVFAKAGDQRALVRVSEIGTAFQPAAGDYIACGCGSTKYTVISGVLDVTQSYWTIFCRRSYT